MRESALIHHHESAGARLGARPEAPDLSSVLTFGDVPAEYRAAQEGACLFDSTDRGCVRVSGGDGADLLHRVLANHIRTLHPGRISPNLLLSPKGKVRAMFDVACTEDGFELSTPPGGAPALMAALDEFLFTEDVTLENITDERAPIDLTGPKAESILEAALATSLELEAGQQVRVDGAITAQVARITVLGRPGWRVDAGPALATKLWDMLVDAGATPAGIVVRDIVRVERGDALAGVDVDDNIYPQEARLDSSFSLEKGCYVGQEVVAKIDTYGGLNKQLHALRIDHDEPVARGTKLMLNDDGEERELGIVTSWAYSFVLDTGLVLAYVKRRHQDVGTTFHFGDASGGATGTATIVDFPA